MTNKLEFRDLEFLEMNLLMSTTQCLTQYNERLSGENPRYDGFNTPEEYVLFCYGMLYGTVVGVLYLKKDCNFRQITSKISDIYYNYTTVPTWSAAYKIVEEMEAVFRSELSRLGVPF